MTNSISASPKELGLPKVKPILDDLFPSGFLLNLTGLFTKHIWIPAPEALSYSLAGHTNETSKKDQQFKHDDSTWAPLLKKKPNIRVCVLLRLR
jgi:hypothetical protein